jgi:hypothetical protein
MGAHRKCDGADGRPRERARRSAQGELRLRISESSTRVTGSLLIEGTECSYSADLKNLQDGIMSCPDRRSVPLVLSIP